MKETTKEEMRPEDEGDCFDIERAEYHFSTKEKGGGKKYYVIVEMDGAERDQYISAMSKRMILDKDTQKPVKMISEGIQVDLLGRCLYEESGPPPNGERGKKAPKSVMLAWRGSVLQKVFDKAQDLNALTAQAEEDAKNG